MSAGLACGNTACFAPLGIASGAMPVRPSLATPPGWSGVCRTSPVEAEPVRVGVDDSAFGSTPGEETASTATRPSALTAPTFGSCWYMTRHVTPVAKAEIAIGRNTIVLKATDHRTRSVRNAKIRPSAVSNDGTTKIQFAMFLIDV